ncbi:PREDICTED: uncharacterized protein LOC108359587 [Rhagoletis zephyria]|uniref:uncharacterized protein LOC108359587 n=1 Tax=Rhagoletis zephyria TaxID=28612 RepID=UPI0008118E27|nr:PREDICTED: uncharacterized protein LOC108359587 [Rhagoletis zephyria]
MGHVKIIFCSSSVGREIKKARSYSKHLSASRVGALRSKRDTKVHYKPFQQLAERVARAVNAAGIVSNTRSRSTEVRAEARGRFFHSDEVANGNHTSCKLCTEAHHISRCERLLGMNNTSRWKVVREEKLCFNCMNSGHRSNRCTYKHKGPARNHGLLHVDGTTHVGATQGVRLNTRESRSLLAL